MTLGACVRAVGYGCRDTTPSWSMRGRLRRELLPLLRDMYGDGVAERLRRGSR